MELVVIVVAVALLQYVYLSFQVGKARGTYGVNAPAVTGNENFERYYRVQQNTLELLVVFIPGILMFAQYFRADVAAGIGAIFVIGRFLYSKQYVADPSSRTVGFILSLLPAVILVIGALIGAVMQVM